MRRAVLTVLLLCSCDADVLLGYSQPLTADGGRDDSGAVDSGFNTGAADDAGPDAGPLTAADSGMVDAGSFDAGVSDGGLADAGTLDAGTFDSGTPDSGMATADSGVDGGSADAGGLDAGPLPSFPHFQLTGPLVLEMEELGTWIASVDAGAAESPDASIITFPPGILLTSGGLCGNINATQVQCEYPSAAPNTTVVATMVMAANDAGLGWHDVIGRLDSEVVTIPLAVTDVGNSVLDFTGGGQNFQVTSCFGTNITSYAQCTPGSFVNGDFTLMGDGTIFTIDGGPTGIWGQSPSHRNLVVRFRLPNGNRGTSLSGASISLSCFEGVIDSPSGTPFAGAWHGCFN